jgi:deazaflavin-dependent oxidoreductase (nitroreductase family)
VTNAAPGTDPPPDIRRRLRARRDPGLAAAEFEHTGRKSGLRRYVVLEVVDHPTRDSYVVASGFGEKAQWCGNAEANARVRIDTGSHAPRPATARVLTQQEADRTLGAYASAHPRAWERFKPVLERTLGEPITETGTPLPIVELRLG